MNELIINTLYYLGSLIVFAVAIIGGTNFMSKGWFLTFLRARASLGKKTMVMCHSVTDTYFRLGYFQDGAFKYKDRDGKDKTYTNISRKDIVHFAGVNAIQIDTVHHAILSLDGSTSPGNNPQTVSEFIKRIIMANKILDTKEKLIIVLLILILLGVGLGGFMIYGNGVAIQSIGKLSGVI